jgi:hypothetical protein
VSDSNIGESSIKYVSCPYSTLRSALAGDAVSPYSHALANSLPLSSPVSGGIVMARAEAKALSLIAPTDSHLDGHIGFSSTTPFTWDPDGVVPGVKPGTWDFFAIVHHELTEVMGRALLCGSNLSIPGSSYYDPLDFAHFSASGVRSFSAGAAGYFSVDNGITNLGNFNPMSSGDPGDWDPSGSPDAFNTGLHPGVTNAVTPNDWREMAALGWGLKAGTVPLPGAAGGRALLASSYSPSSPSFIYQAASNTVATIGNALSPTGPGNSFETLGALCKSTSMFAASPADQRAGLIPNTAVGVSSQAIAGWTHADTPTDLAMLTAGWHSPGTM